MTHSTRKSYKEKWLEAKKAEDTKPLDQITDAARLIREANEYRSKETELIKELASSVVELIEMMDHPDGKSVLRDEKDYRKPIDSHLPNFDNMLVLRRTRDVVRRATDRIGMLGLAAKDNESQVIDYRSVAQTLTKPTEAISRGIFSSYIVGPSPTVDEMERALDNKGKNPRTIDYVYHTDDSDSEDEKEDDNDADDDEIDSSSDSVLTKVESQLNDAPPPSALNAIVKPKSPARKKKESSHNINIV